MERRGAAQEGGVGHDQWVRDGWRSRLLAQQLY